MPLNKITSVFRDFESRTETGAKSLARTLDVQGLEAKQEVSLFQNLIELLYPDPAGSFHNAANFFNEIKNLGSGGQGDEAQKRYQQIAKLVRLYYTSINSQADTLEGEIKAFYVDSDKGRRPSAYKTLNVGAGSSDGIWAEKSFREMIFSRDTPPPESNTNSKKPSLLYILLDTPAIDMRLRSADKAEAFINYVPSHIASMLVPYLDVDFTFARNLTEQDGTKDSPSRRLTTMSQLKFLLGGESLQAGQTANLIMFDATEKRIWTPQIETRTTDASKQSEDDFYYAFAGWQERKKRAAVDNKVFKEPEPKLADYQSRVVPPNPSSTTVAGSGIYSAGMELFTMPQTLVNMNKYKPSSQSPPRYNPVINPMLPFGAITGLTIDVRPSLGTMSFKTATLTMKIFDRSRLVEIADFINPKLYQAVTLWITYGWRAPKLTSDDSTVETYSTFINNNMLKREAYGVKNASVSIEKDGTATLTLSLFTRGGAEMIEVKDVKSAKFENAQAQWGAKLANLKRLAEKLNLQAFVNSGKDVRGSMLVSAALAGNLIDIDSKTLDAELKALNKALADAGGEAATFQAILSDVYTIVGDSKKSAFQSNMDSLAKAAAGTRFNGLKSNSVDLFAYHDASSIKIKNKGNNKQAQSIPSKYAGDADPATTQPLAKAMTQLTNKGQGATTTASSLSGLSAGAMGSLSFGRVFSHYFASIANALTDDNTVDEIQVVFYTLNSLAGLVSGINIAEFPIELGELEKAYSKRVSEQKGEMLSFNMLLEVIRESQFSNIQHPIYGFRDLYKTDKTGRLEPDESKQSEMSSRIVKNFGLSGPFTIPVIEFYIETGYDKGAAANAQQSDLLYRFESSRGGVSRAPSDPNVKKIMRIHIYDKASTPHQEALQILSTPDGSLYSANFSEINNSVSKKRNDVIVNLENAKKIKNQKEKKVAVQNAQQEATLLSGLSTEVKNDVTSFLGETSPPTTAAIQDSLLKTIFGGDPPSGVEFNSVFRKFSFRDENGYASFEKVKQEISRLVPTITLGTNASMIESVNYSSANDALLSTIMMLRNSKSSPNPAEPSGAGVGDLPLRVIPGSLSISTMGCPLLEYMQQFFVDLGTGTTIDNLYNITGLTHTFTPGKFITQIKFTFADAYGTYESPASFADGVAAQIGQFTNEFKAQAAQAKKQQNATKPAPAKPAAPPK